MARATCRASSGGPRQGAASSGSQLADCCAEAPRSAGRSSDSGCGRGFGFFCWRRRCCCCFGFGFGCHFASRVSLNTRKAIDRGTLPVPCELHAAKQVGLLAAPLLLLLPLLLFVLGRCYVIGAAGAGASGPGWLAGWLAGFGWSARGAECPCCAPLGAPPGSPATGGSSLEQTTRLDAAQAAHVRPAACSRAGHEEKSPAWAGWLAGGWRRRKWRRRRRRLAEGRPRVRKRRLRVGQAALVAPPTGVRPTRARLHNAARMLRPAGRLRSHSSHPSCSAGRVGSPRVEPLKVPTKSAAKAELRLELKLELELELEPPEWSANSLKDAQAAAPVSAQTEMAAASGGGGGGGGPQWPRPRARP